MLRALDGRICGAPWLHNFGCVTYFHVFNHLSVIFVISCEHLVFYCCFFSGHGAEVV